MTGHFIRLLTWSLSVLCVLLFLLYWVTLHMFWPLWCVFMSSLSWILIVFCFVFFRAIVQLVCVQLRLSCPWTCTIFFFFDHGLCYAFFLGYIYLKPSSIKCCWHLTTETRIFTFANLPHREQSQMYLRDLKLCISLYIAYTQPSFCPCGLQPRLQ